MHSRQRYAEYYHIPRMTMFNWMRLPSFLKYLSTFNHYGHFKGSTKSKKF